MRGCAAIIGGLLVASLASAAIADQTNTVSWQQVSQQANLAPLVKDSLRFLTAVTKGDFSDAQRRLAMKDEVRDQLQQGHIADLIGQLDLRPPYTIHLAAVDVMTDDDVILIYIINTADGPVAFKMDTFRYDGAENMAHMVVSNDWDEIETMLNAAQRLDKPLEIQVNPLDPDGDPEIVPPEK